MSGILGARARALVSGAVIAVTAGLLGAPMPAASAAQPVPGHVGLVPDKPRTDTPNIPNGEIWDMEVVGSRVFIAGSFTSIRNKKGDTTTLNQQYLASYNINTGLIDTTFRPRFDGSVNAVEASPDGTKLFVAGAFNTVSGVTRRKVASLNLTTGVPVAGFNFTRGTNNQATALAVTNSTVYVGGRFTKVNGVARTGLAAVNSTTGAIDLGFDNSISGGIGPNGVLTVQQLKLTHDERKLVVVHTGRRIDGQDRYGVGIIDTQTKDLLPWRTRLWDDNLMFTGGIMRAYAADVAPNDEFFVVGSGTGGDRPPINDVAIAFPMSGDDFVEPLWISRHFDSVYSVAVSEAAVYVGGHFVFQESPTSPDPWPGQENVGYGNGQGIGAYALGDSVVRRDHIGALDPATGKALEWHPGSTSFEGEKAMEVTERGLFVGGDGLRKGGVSTGRVAFFDLNTLPAPSALDTRIVNPIEGRIVPAGTEFVIDGTATTATNTGVRRVQVDLKDTGSNQYLQDNGTWSRTYNNIYADLASPSASSTAWSLPVTVTGSRALTLTAKTFALSGARDGTKAVKRLESFSYEDDAPRAGYSSPGAGVLTSTEFTVTGTATDDNGIASLSYWFRNQSGQYLQEDGSLASERNSFRGLPDVVGATNATWRYDVKLPHEGIWKMSVTPVDTGGRSSLDNFTREWTINSDAQAPSVSINAPVAMVPPTATPALTVAPGSPLTFSGGAVDEKALSNVEIQLRNTTTRENLASDGSWGTDVILGWHRLSPANFSGTSYNWSYTTPFDLRPGTYTFTVRATDHDKLTTSSANQGKLTVNVQVPGDAPPDTRLDFTGTRSDIESLHLDLTGTATDDLGVSNVQVALFDADSGRYVQPNGTLAPTFASLPATLATPGGTSTSWTLPVDLPASGDYTVGAFAFDTSGQQDTSTSGATARYLVFPGDLDPWLWETLKQPTDGVAFTESRIVVSGRAEDDTGMAKVEVAVINSAGRYMSSTGTFTSTSPSWRAAFLTSPGSMSSNYAYTTPAIPDGTYRVQVRGVDVNDQAAAVPSEVTVTVSSPAGNQAPVAAATVTCTNNNNCTFDGRSSTDENAPTLTYSWNFGNGRTATGPVPTHYYTGPGTFTVTLTVQDEYGLSGTATLPVTITEPPDNLAPVPVINQPACKALVCNLSGVGTADPNPGDTFKYLWNFGDGTATSTSSAMSHTFPAPGTYTVTLTVTDGWGKSATVTRDVTITEPVDNQPPTPVINEPTCTALVCTFSAAGTADPNGDTVKYLWNFGDGTPTSTSSVTSHTFPAAGPYTVTLTATDGWGKSATVTRDVTVGQEVTQ